MKRVFCALLLGLDIIDRVLFNMVWKGEWSVHLIQLTMKYIFSTMHQLEGKMLDWNITDILLEKFQSNFLFYKCS